MDLPGRRRHQRILASDTARDPGNLPAHFNHRESGTERGRDFRVNQDILHFPMAAHTERTNTIPGTGVADKTGIRSAGEVAIKQGRPAVRTPSRARTAVPCEGSRNAQVPA